jgi:hypothetical protein
VPFVVFATCNRRACEEQCLNHKLSVGDVGSGDNLNAPLKTRGIPRGGHVVHCGGLHGKKSSHLRPRVTQLLHSDLAEQPPRHRHTPGPALRPKARLLLRGTSGHGRFLHLHALGHKLSASLQVRKAHSHSHPLPAGTTTPSGPSDRLHLKHKFSSRTRHDQHITGRKLDLYFKRSRPRSHGRLPGRLRVARPRSESVR